MAHNFEHINDIEASALTIRPDHRSGLSPTELRITKLGGVGGGTHKGLKIKPRRVGVGTPGPVEIRGEDLYALREFLRELPEEAFTRPADPVEKPARWSAGDIVEETFPSGAGPARVWVRDGDGEWHRYGGIPISDFTIQDGLRDRYVTTLTIIRQKSGQDL